MIKRFARWVLRRELRWLESRGDHWKKWALVQERYRLEVFGETPADPEFRDWFFKTFPTKESLNELIEQKGSHGSIIRAREGVFRQ